MATQMEVKKLRRKNSTQSLISYWTTPNMPPFKENDKSNQILINCFDRLG